MYIDTYGKVMVQVHAYVGGNPNRVAFKPIRGFKTNIYGNTYFTFDGTHIDIHENIQGTRVK